MSLTLYYHPLASFCWKALIALYENETPFEPHFVDLADELQRTQFLSLAPFGKFPLLRDAARDKTIPESSIIIEYLSTHYPGKVALVPSDPELALEVRLSDRFYDFYVHQPMQRVVLDRLRPEGMKDPHGVERAKAELQEAYDFIEREMTERRWAAGDAFSMADCAAAPALYYANRVSPFGAKHTNVARYLTRLHERPSFARTFAEAAPYLANFPE
jgi:glutathione S-transferase